MLFKGLPIVIRIEKIGEIRYTGGMAAFAGKVVF